MCLILFIYLTLRYIGLKIQKQFSVAADYDNSITCINSGPFSALIDRKGFRPVKSAAIIPEGSLSGKSDQPAWSRPNSEQVAQLSQRHRATHELLRFAKLKSGIFEPPFRGLRET